MRLADRPLGPFTQSAIHGTNTEAHLLRKIWSIADSRGDVVGFPLTDNGLGPPTRPAVAVASPKLSDLVVKGVVPGEVIRGLGDALD